VLRLLSTLTFLYSEIVNFCVLKDTFLRSIHKHIRVFCLLADIPTFATFNMDHTPLELVKPYKNLCSFRCQHSNSYFQHFKCFCACQPFTAQINVHTHSPSIRTQKSHMERQTFVPNKILLNYHMC